MNEDIYNCCEKCGHVWAGPLSEVKCENCRSIWLVSGLSLEAAEDISVRAIERRTIRIKQ